MDRGIYALLGVNALTVVSTETTFHDCTEDSLTNAAV